VKRDTHWEDKTHPMSKMRSRQVSRSVYETYSKASLRSGHKALSREAMTHRAQNLSGQQSRVQGHRPAKENNHRLRAMMDMILKDLMVFGSVLLVVSAILYLIFIF
jgi:hypothetical protein